MEGQRGTATGDVKGKKPRVPSTGRRKIPMQKIEKKEALMVTFSKRRKGLFKKAKELSILCGTEVAVIVYSPAGRPFACSHPSSSPVSLIQRFLRSVDASDDVNDGNDPPVSVHRPYLDLNYEPADEQSIEEMGLDKLISLEKRLEEEIRR